MSDNVYNYATQWQKREGIGEREEIGRPRRFYCFLNSRFSEMEILDWSATCQSVLTKSSQSQWFDH